MNNVVLTVCVFIVIGLAATCPPPTLPPGGKWVSNPGCKKGGVYFQGNQKCNCWGHCGYICRPNASTTKKPSPCPYGGVWYNPKGERCICQSFNQKPYYKCEPTTTVAATDTTVAEDTTTMASSDSTTSATSSSDSTTTSSSDSTTTSSSDSTTMSSSDSTTTSSSDSTTTSSSDSTTTSSSDSTTTSSSDSTTAATTSDTTTSP